MINMNTNMSLFNLKQSVEVDRKVDEFSPKNIINNEIKRVKAKTVSNKNETFSDKMQDASSRVADKNVKKESSNYVEERVEKSSDTKDNVPVENSNANDKQESVKKSNTESAKIDNSSDTKEESVVEDVDNSVNSAALKILVDSLKKISEKLDLNVDLSGGLDNIDFENPTEAVIEQLSEIVFTVKEISSLLAKAGEENVALDINGMVIEPADASLVEKSMRVDLFRIEVALNSLGVSSEVSSEVAEKQGVASSAGIPVALNPEDLSMSQDQLRQILGEAVEADEDKVKAILAKMNLLADEKSKSNIVEVEKKIIAESVSVRASSKDAQNEKGVQATFESPVMRKLLKIDKGMDVVIDSGEVSKAVEKNSISTIKIEPVVTGENINKLSINQQTANNQSSVLKSGVESIEAVSSFSAKSENSSMEMTKVPTVNMLGKTPEDIVMSQVTKRFNFAIKNGITEMRLALKPESLGKVDISIRVENDIVTAKVMVENIQVKQIVESNLTQLKDALEEHNLHAGAFDVDVNQGEKKEQDETTFAKGRGQSSSKESDSELKDSNLTDVESREDTGRRYGSNSVEYFA